MTEAVGIPVLDATALETGNRQQRTQLVADFREAYESIGFSYVVNHGVDQGLIDEVFEASCRFHALPHEEKMRLELNSAHRGFLAINRSTDTNTQLAEVTAPNQSESFIAMCEHGPHSTEMTNGDYLAGQNVWPDLAGFANTVMQFHSAMCELGRAMMRIAVEAIGGDPNTIVAHFDSPIALVRLLRYPPHPVDAAAGVFGSAPHRDFGCLTFLAQDNSGGLAVGTPAGDWIDVEPLDGAFVMNVGDMLRQWSNGRLLSTPHRVINQSGRERYSVPFFFDPNPATVIAPLPSCVTSERPPQYDAVLFGDHLRSEFEAGFDHHSTQAPSA